MAVVTKAPETRFIGKHSGFFKVDTAANEHNFKTILGAHGLEPLTAKEILPMLMDLRNLGRMFYPAKESVSFYLKNEETFFEEGYGRRVIAFNKNGQMELHRPESRKARSTLGKLESLQQQDLFVSIHPGIWTPMLTVLNSATAIEKGYRFRLSGEIENEGANTLVGTLPPKEFENILLRGLSRG
jgi:hypothetical protein